MSSQTTLSPRRRPESQVCRRVVHALEDGFLHQRRASWARLLQKILEVDPLLCSRCRAEMKIVSVITDPAVVDRILAGMRERGECHARRRAECWGEGE